MKIFSGKGMKNKDMKNKFSYFCQLHSLELWNALYSCSEHFILWCCTLEGWLVLHSCNTAVNNFLQHVWKLPHSSHTAQLKGLHLWTICIWYITDVGIF